MGITIKNKNMGIDMGYHGFFLLRKNIAYLISEDFGRLYEQWCGPFGHLTDEEGNKKLKILYSQGKMINADELVLKFLFESDGEGKLSVNGCKKLYELIKDYDDNILYGYVGRPDCAKFKDFKEIIKQSAKSRLVVRWN